ncbi:hypothetical protein ES703_78819 [subsurface metagenome]
MEDSKKAPKSKEETKKRREEVLDDMEEFGPFSMPVKELAEKWKCSKQTIYKDRDSWIKKLKFKDISLEGKRLLYNIKENIKLGEKLRTRGKDKDRIKAAELINKSAETFTRIMEQFEFKRKIADTYQIEGLPATFNLIEKSVEEIKDAKTRSKPKARPGDKSKTKGNSKGSG